MKFSWWKLLGLAGVGGVAATGAIIARDQRQRAQLTPDDVRARLHQRLVEAEGDDVGDGPATEQGSRRR